MTTMYFLSIFAIIIALSFDHWLSTVLLFISAIFTAVVGMHEVYKAVTVDNLTSTNKLLLMIIMALFVFFAGLTTEVLEEFLGLAIIIGSWVALYVSCLMQNKYLNQLRSSEGGK